MALNIEIIVLQRYHERGASRVQMQITRRERSGICFRLHTVHGKKIN